MVSALTLLLCSLVTQATGQAPKIEANGTNIVLTVSTGANVMIRRGNGPPEAVLTASDLASINARLATLETLASQTQASLRAAVQPASLTSLERRLNQSLSAVSERLSSGLGEVAASWSGDFDQAFNFSYNTGRIDMPANYRPLTRLSGNAIQACIDDEYQNTYGVPNMNCSNAFSCNGQWIPNGGGCGAGAIWTLISAEISHPGRGLTQTSQTWDSFAISSYTVRKEGLYSITNGSISSPPSRPYGATGYQVLVQVQMPDADADDVALKTLDRMIFPVRSWGHAATEFSFDHLLGFLPVDAIIHVAVGPSKDDGGDSFVFDFDISRGALPALSPALPGLGSRALGGGNPRVSEITWSGTTTSNTWQTIVHGAGTSQTADDEYPVLQDGGYILHVGSFSTFVNGGGLYAERVVSAPFAWDNTPTNSAAEFPIASHMAGHANNGEQLSFRTVRSLGGTGGAGSPALLLQFRTNRNWATTIKLNVQFIRLF